MPNSKIRQIKLPNNTIYDITDASITTMGGNADNNLENKDIIVKYIASRGENLLTNGTALLGNNYNFSSLTYDGSDTYYAGGCFKKDNWASYASFVNDEYIPVDVSKKYTFDFWTKTNTTGAQVNGMIKAYDIDKLEISSYSVAPKAGTLTTLTQALNIGDTKIYLNDISGFSTNMSSVNTKSLLFWGYTNSFGYKYPDETYTRYRYTNLWSTVEQLDFTNNIITLDRAWSGPAFAAGTSVSQGQDGSGAIYVKLDNTSITADLTPPNWEHHFGVIDGLQNKNSFPDSKFPFGTAYIRIGLMNRPTGAGQNFKISTMTFSMNASSSDLPSVNDATLTIQKNGSTITTFTANSAINKTANIIVPTAGSTATAVSTTASGGSAETFSKSDHVHNITDSTIISALGYTPQSILNYTPENVANKLQTWSQEPSSVYYPSEILVKGEIDSLRNAIEGQRTAYVMSIVDNLELNSSTDIINVDVNLIDVDGMTVPLSALQKGDVIYIMEQNIPDRWVGDNQSTILPEGYTKLSYIEGAGASYIDTQIVPTVTDISLSLDMMWTGSTLSDFESFTGFMATSTTPRFGIHKYSSKYMYGINSTINVNAPIPDNARHVLKTVSNGITQYLYVDGANVSSSSVASSALSANQQSIYIFARNSATMNIASMRLYGAQIYINGDPYSFVPCKNTNDEIGLYETNHGEFYKSATSTPFTAGPVSSNSVQLIALETASIDIDSYYTKAQVNSLLAAKQDIINANNPLPYSYLSNTPHIPDNTDYVDLTTNQSIGGVKTFTSRPMYTGNDPILLQSDMASVAFSGSYSDLINIPGTVYVIDYIKHDADGEHEDPWYTCDHTYSQIEAIDAENNAILAVYHDGTDTTTGMISYDYDSHAFLSTFYFFGSSRGDAGDDELGEIDRKNVIRHSSDNSISLVENIVIKPYVVTYTQTWDAEQEEYNQIQCDRDNKDIIQARSRGYSLFVKFERDNPDSSSDYDLNLSSSNVWFAAVSLFGGVIITTFIDPTAVIVGQGGEFNFDTKLGYLIDFVQTEEVEGQEETHRGIIYETQSLGGGNVDLSDISKSEIIRYEIEAKEYEGTTLTLDGITFVRVSEKGFNFNEFTAGAIMTNAQTGELISAMNLEMQKEETYGLGYLASIDLTQSPYGDLGTIYLGFVPSYENFQPAVGDKSIVGTNIQGLYFYYTGNIQTLSAFSLEIFLMGKSLRDLDECKKIDSNTSQQIFCWATALYQMQSMISTTEDVPFDLNGLIRISDKRIPLNTLTSLRLLPVMNDQLKLTQFYTSEHIALLNACHVLNQDGENYLWGAILPDDPDPVVVPIFAVNEYGTWFFQQLQLGIDFMFAWEDSTPDYPIVDVTLNGTSAVTNKIAQITVPTAVSDLTNDLGFTDNIGTITEITMNGTSLGTSGSIDLGTVITDVSNKVDKVNSTDEAIVRFDGTSGDIQNSVVTVADTGSIIIGGVWTGTSASNPYIQMGNSATSTDNARLTANNTGAFTFAPSNTPTFLATRTEFRPISNTANAVDIGSASYAFRNGFFATSIQAAQIYTTGSTIKRIAAMAASPTVNYTYTLPNATGTIALISNIPTNVSSFTNDSGYITNTVNDLTNYTLSSSLATVATSGDYNDLNNKPTIPTQTSQLTNNSGFITANDIPLVFTDYTIPSQA